MYCVIEILLLWTVHWTLFLQLKDKVMTFLSAYFRVCCISHTLKPLITWLSSHQIRSHKHVYPKYKTIVQCCDSCWLDSPLSCDPARCRVFRRLRSQAKALVMEWSTAGPCPWPSSLRCVQRSSTVWQRRTTYPMVSHFSCICIGQSDDETLLEAWNGNLNVLLISWNGTWVKNVTEKSVIVLIFSTSAVYSVPHYTERGTFSNCRPIKVRRQYKNNKHTPFTCKWS